MSEASHKPLIFWVDPESTAKTIEDELDDMFCAPCLTKMLQGSCGKTMEMYLRCVYTANKTNSSFEPCAITYKSMVECWLNNPKEYARELKKVSIPDQHSESL